MAGFMRKIGESRTYTGNNKANNTAKGGAVRAIGQQRDGLDADEAVEYAAARAGTDFLRVGEGVVDAALVPVDLITGNVEKAKSRFMDSPVDAMRERLDERYNPGKGMQVVGDIAGGIGQSIGYGLISAIPYAGKPMMYSSIIEQGISSAAQQTGDVGLKEIAYGATTGAIEGALESKLGAGVQGIKSIGSAILKKSGVDVAKSAAKVGGKSMLKSVLTETAKGAAGEFAEEAISEAVDPLLLRTFNIDENAKGSLGNVLYAGVIGAVSGGLMSAGPAAVNYKTSVNVGRTLQEKGLDTDLVTRAKYTVKGFDIADKRAQDAVSEVNAEDKKAAKAASKNAKRVSKQTAELADKIEKNVAAYERYRNDPKTRDADATAAILGELRGNLFLVGTSYEIDTVEAFMIDSDDRRRQEFVDVVNEILAEQGEKHDYTLADFDNDTDQIRRRLAGQLLLEELMATEGAQSPVETQEDVWAGMPDGTDFTALGATGEAETALLKEAITQSVPKGSVKEMLNQYRKGTNLTPAEFAEAWSDGVHVYGRYGLNTEGTADTAFNRMEQEAREAAVKYGRETAEAETKAKEEAAKKKKNPAPKPEGKEKREGRVVKGEGLDVQKLSDEQYAAYKAAEILAKTLGTDIVIETTIAPRAGKVTNGYYNLETNAIHININALKSGKNVALYTLAHEVTHYVKEWSPAKFKTLSDFVMEHLDEDAEILIANKLALLKQIPDYKNLSADRLRDLAVEDVVCDGMELVLTDGAVIEELARTDKTLWEKIRDWIMDIIGQIRRSYESLNGTSKTAQVLAETMETFDEIEQLFAEAVTEAGERTKTAEYGVEIDETTGTALFSVQDAPQNEEEFNAAVNRLVAKLGVDKTRAENWVKSEMSLSALILREDMYEWAHKKADRRRTAIVKNSDYKQGTLDFSNICRKRRQYTKMMERLQKQFPNRLFTAEDFALIRDILVGEDIEVACGLCYVEDRRQNEGYIATNFREAVQSWRAGNKTTFRDSKSEKDVEYSKGAAKAMEMLGSDTYVPTIADLTTVDGMAELGKEHPNVLKAWNAFNNSRGMQSSRLVTAESEYQRQILKYNKNRVKAINDLGGLRIFSFSDFEEFHLIDIIQAVQDCAAMGIKIQFYTKVPSFAYLMKDTRAKGNMSLIPKGKLGYHLEDGRVVLDYDNVEGINTTDEYFKNLSRDNPNIGTVLVGINETHIRAAMADSFIDYIIPFHTGQSGIVRQIKKIDAWENYKDVQTEKWLTKAEEGEKRGSPGVNIYTDVLQAAEKEGRPITNERQFVEKFLQVCETKGVKPRFWEFLDTDADGKYVYTKGYYKLLLDFKMFDKNGEILPQETVVPEFDDKLLTELTEKYVASEKEVDTKTGAAFARAYDQIVDRVINRNDPIYRTIKQPKLAPAVPNVKGVEVVKRADKVFSLGEEITTDMNETSRAKILRSKTITPAEIVVPKNFDVSLDDLEKNRKSAVEKPLIKKLREMGHLTEYQTNAIGVSFDFTAAGLRKSMNSQVNDYGGNLKDLAKVVMNMQAILDSSVLVEIHSDKGKGTPRENPQLIKTFVLMSALREGAQITPVQFEVKQFVDNENRLYLAVALTKIETGVMGDTIPDRNRISTRLLPVSDISIPQFIEKINPRDEKFFKYVPDEFLNDDQKEAKKRALAKDEAKYGKKYSLSEEISSDTAYLSAVNRGDMETAQRMVDEAAKAAGYTEEMFHGMGGRYNVYKSGNGQYGSGVYFTADKDIAADYGKVVDHLYVKVGKIADYEDAYKALGKTDDQTLDDFAQTLGFPNFDEMVNDWDNDPTDVASNSELMEMLKNRGFEGFLDDGNAGFVLWDFDGIAYRIKSADPVTYDDAGNVIPLSERFNEANPDIRYSLGEDTAEPALTDRDMLLAMAEQMVGSEEENKIISNYKAQYDTVRTKQNRINELSARQRELQSILFSGDSDAKARSNASKELKTILDEMNTLLEDVAKVDRKLTEIEGMRVIRNLIQRERLAVRNTYKNKYETMYKRKTEARDTTNTRRSVRRLYNRVNRLLFSPTKTRNVPIGMQSIVAEALRAANVDTEAIERLGQLEEQLAALERDPAPDTAKMAELEERIEEQERRVGKVKDQVNMLIEIFEATNDQDADGETRLVFDDAVLQKLKELRKDIGNASIRNMDRNQLLALKDFYEMIWHRIKTANNTLASNRKLEINKVGEQSSREVRDSKTLKILSPKAMELVGAKGARKYIWSNLKPLTAFEAIGSDSFMNLFREVLNGENTWARDLEEAYNAIKASKDKHGYDDWNMIERKTVKTADGEVELSLSEIMSLYAYSFREQAQSHLMGGGFVLDPNATARVKGKKLSFVELERRLNNPTRYTLTEAQIRTLGNYLTEAQRAYVEEVQRYLTNMGEKGNEVSRKLYGIDIFREQHYFPIKVKSEYLESQTGKTGDPKIKNRGMTKEIVPKAKNPLVLQDFMAVAGDHINSMATYHAFVLPVEDLTRVLNFKPTNVKLDKDGNPILDENGMPVADESATVKYDTLKSEIEAKYGAEAVHYIEQLIRDLNGGARRDAAATLLDQGLTAFKRATTMLSLSTIIQQPTSVFRAMAYVDAKWFTGAKMYDYETIKKYAPVAIMKEIGGFDTGTGMRTAEYLNSKEYKTFREKLKAIALPESKGGDPAYRAEAFGWLTGKADEITWRYMFGAIVNEQAAKLGKPADSEAVLKAAGERFTDVVRRTQVYDSTLTRSEYMRSKDTGAKLLTQFAAEPTTVVSMIVDGLIKAERGDKSFFKKTAAAVAASIIINAMASSLIYAMRDDDEDKNILEKYVSSLTGELIEGFNPLEYLPFFRDIMSIFKGYDVERSDMTLIGNLFDQIELITSSKRSFADKLFGVTGAVTAFFGIPVTNVYRDVKGVITTGASFVDSEPVTGRGLSGAVNEGVKGQYSLIYKLFGAQDGNAYELYKAAASGDTAHYDRVAARYASASAAEQALRKELRENDRRIYQAAEAKLSGDLDVYESIVDQIEAEGHFDRNLVVRAVNNEVLEIKDAVSTAIAPKTDDVEEAEEETAEALYTATDLADAMERGDTDDFKTVYDYLISRKTEQGQTEAQAKSAVRSSVTAKYKRLYLAAWEQNNTAEMKRILELLRASGLYGTYNDTAKTVEKWVRESKS